METRIIWFSLVPIYACLFLIFIPYTDAGDIETHISRINESETIYYRYMGFLLSLGDNIFPMVIENSYRVYIGSYREYTFSLQRLYVFFVHLPFFLIYVYFTMKTLKHMDFRTNIHLFLLFPVLMIFSSVGMDVAFIAVVSASFYVYIKRHNLILALLICVVYFILFADKGILVFTGWLLFDTIFSRYYDKRFMLLLLSFIVYMSSASLVDLLVVYVQNVYDVPFIKTLISATFYGNYPFIVLGLSLFSSTIYSFFNIGFFLFCVIGACLKLNVKIFKNRYLFSYFVYFIFFIAIFTNASAIRFHPLLLFFFMAWFSLNFSRRQIIVSEIMTLTGVFISVITGVLL